MQAGGTYDLKDPFYRQLTSWYPAAQPAAAAAQPWDPAASRGQQPGGQPMGMGVGP